MSDLRVLVCGGREYDNRDAVFRTLNDLTGEVSDEHPLGTIQLTIIHGACPTGADLWADEWAVVNWAQFEEYPADWGDLETPPVKVKRRKDGTPYNCLAGFNRNQRMLDEGKPDLVVAFPGGRGTADMVRRAKAAGVKVIQVPQRSGRG